MHDGHNLDLRYIFGKVVALLPLLDYCLGTGVRYVIFPEET